MIHNIRQSFSEFQILNSKSKSYYLRLTELKQYSNEIHFWIIIYNKFIWVRIFVINNDIYLKNCETFILSSWLGPCHGSGGWSPAFQSGGLGSIPVSVHVGFVVDKVALGQVFSYQFLSTGAPSKSTSWKTLINFIFLIGLHNKPSRLWCVRSICCGALKKRAWFKIFNWYRQLQNV
jgi:hypothetical protein